MGVSISGGLSLNNQRPQNIQRNNQVNNNGGTLNGINRNQGNQGYQNNSYSNTNINTGNVPSNNLSFSNTLPDLSSVLSNNGGNVQNNNAHTNNGGYQNNNQVNSNNGGYNPNSLPSLNDGKVITSTTISSPQHDSGNSRPSSGMSDKQATYTGVGTIVGAVGGYMLGKKALIPGAIGAKWGAILGGGIAGTIGYFAGKGK